MLTLDDMLNAKEERFKRRTVFQQNSEQTVISLTLNMPGQEKNSFRTKELFKKAVDCLNNACCISKSQIVYEKTGPHGLFATDCEPLFVKTITCQLEEKYSYARLWDIDVYDKAGQVVADKTRTVGRKCFICDNISSSCMREQKHSMGEILQQVDKMFVDFFADQSNCISKEATFYGSLALEALLYEVACSPSPGLVDPVHNGSHKDMDFFTFQRSCASIAHHLNRFVEAGLQHVGSTTTLLPALKKIGLECEQAMFTATDNINTQKGLIFSMGLVLGATGIALHSEEKITANKISTLVKELTSGLVQRELDKNDDIVCTAGEQMYQKFAIKGIRGEAEAGFPSVINVGLPILKFALADGYDVNKSLLKTLLHLMTEVTDTTILHRKPELEALDWVKQQAKIYLIAQCFDDDDWQDKLWSLDKAFVERNLSPGGSADLLAITWYLYKVENSVQN